MIRPRSKQWLGRTAAWAVLAAAPLVGAGWYFGIRSFEDVIAYIGMSRECHPIWKDLALKQVRAGRPVTEVIGAFPPTDVARHGAYMTVRYLSPGPVPPGLAFTGITLIAKNDQLVAADAWSCTWRHVFFDELSEGERFSDTLDLWRDRPGWTSRIGR